MQLDRVRVPRLREHLARWRPARPGSPRSITPTRWHEAAHEVQVVRDEQDRHAVLALQVVEQREDLRLDRHVERGRRLVGDQQLRAARERHRDHRALALAARQLVRIRVDASLRIGNAGARAAARSRGRAPRACPGPRAARAPRRSGCPPCTAGSSAVIGSWKIIAMSRPRSAAHLAARSSRARPRPRTGSRLRTSPLEQPQHRQRGDRLARARFADEREFLAGATSNDTRRRRGRRRS